MDSAKELEALLDREAIRNCLARLARGEDRRDPDLIRASYWQDSVSDYGVFKGTFDEYFAWVIPGSPAIPVTQHILGQSHVELRRPSAWVETHVTSYHRIDTGAEHRDVVLGGRYLDRFELRKGEWRIAERTMLYDWEKDLGVSVDWSKGVMGYPFSGPHFPGRAVGDHSVTFFAKARS